jgi:predicted RNA-binding Zn-ribbon protein involved in translation (DUF1610 family)
MVGSPKQRNDEELNEKDRENREFICPECGVEVMRRAIS